MKKLQYIVPTLAVAIVAVIAVGAFSASADSYTQGFESMTVGSVNGQNGWTVTGPYDQGVVSSPVISGTRSFRLSNSTTSGSFGDQTFSQSLANEAGEASSTNAGMSGGTRQTHFEAQFDFKSTQTAVQPGLFISISPDRGDGSRMSYLGLEDSVSGINVIFYDVQGTSSPANFVSTQVATGLDRSVAHTAKLVIDYVNGPSNDVVKVYIDGILVHTGTTWENYYRYDAEASVEQTPRTTDSLLFRAGGTAVPSTAGMGFVFDNVMLLSSSTVVVAPASLAAEDFGVVSYNTGATGDLKGYTAGFGLSNGTLASSTSVVVKLYGAGDVLLQTNTAILSKFNADITGTQFSSPFDVSGNFNYALDGYWTNVRQTQYGQSVPAVKVVATVTLASGQVVTATNTNLTGDPTTIYPVVTPPPATPANKDQCKDSGWKSFTDPSFKNQGQCVSYVQSNEKAGKRN
ncbi:MAG: hypothetical protein V4481_01530 [Patescibacteria group bacterium]